jgi:hypothetical protein
MAKAVGTVRATAALALAAALLLVAAPVLAQTANPELSCSPETVTAGATVTCRVTGVAPSRAVRIELLDGTRLLAAADGVADTQGRATLDLAVPGPLPAGPLAISLVGSGIELPVSVGPTRPSGVSAGLGPSQAELARRFPALAVLAVGITLAVAGLPGLRRRGARPGTPT